MSSTQPSFENQQIVNSFNLFIDSERCVVQGDQQSRGDDVHIQFECNSIEAGDGEMIRLAVTDFSMPNNMDMIDFNNSRGLLKATSSHVTAVAPAIWGLSETVDLIDRQNYSSIYDVAVSFGIMFKQQLDRLVDTTLRAFTVGYIISPEYDKTYVPSSIATGGISGGPSYGLKNVGRPPMSTGSRFLQIEFDCKLLGTGGIPAPSGVLDAHGISALKIQLMPRNGDTYCILGGRRLDTDSETFDSLVVDLSDPQKVKITGYYPMQRYTEPHVYLRSNTGQNGLEMSVLQAGVIATGNVLVADIVTSNILGKFPRFENNEGGGDTIIYNTSTGMDYFINLQQRKLTSLQLFLTDSKGRKIGRFTDDVTTGTAAGRETDPATNPPTYADPLQNTLGNLFFTATIRVDIIKASNPVKLESKVFPPPANGSKAGGVLPMTGFTNRPIGGRHN
jgi:hypothetical protein